MTNCVSKKLIHLAEKQKNYMFKSHVQPLIKNPFYFLLVKFCPAVTVLNLKMMINLILSLTL